MEGSNPSPLPLPERNSPTARVGPIAADVKRGAYLTAAAVAELLGVDRASIYRWAETDATMPATRLGAGTLRFRSDLLNAWLEARTQPSRNATGAQGRGGAC
jgi:excisionase family DNA binding protein